MRDLHLVPGKKQFVETIEKVHALIKSTYPVVFREGSIGSWHWHTGLPDKEIVAEAWIHLAKDGWWVRVKSK